MKEGHPFQDHVETKIKKLYIYEEDFRFRHYDLTEITDEPGNTCLWITFVSTLAGDLLDKTLKERLIELLGEDEGNGGPGDFEEFIVFNQNNELVVLINSNK